MVFDAGSVLTGSVNVYIPLCVYSFSSLSCTAFSHKPHLRVFADIQHRTLFPAEQASVVHFQFEAEMTTMSEGALQEKISEELLSGFVGFDRTLKAMG